MRRSVLNEHTSKIIWPHILTLQRFSNKQLLNFSVRACFKRVSRRSIGNYAPIAEYRRTALTMCTQHCIMAAGNGPEGVCFFFHLRHQVSAFLGFHLQSVHLRTRQTAMQTLRQ